MIVGGISADIHRKDFEVVFIPPTLVPASQFSIQSLTDAYNQTRVDYMVPMPLNAARLTEYIQIYDIDMERSVVAVNDGNVLGINMIGLRRDQTWITRLGVLPHERRHGAGEGMSRSDSGISPTASRRASRATRFLRRGPRSGNCAMTTDIASAERNRSRMRSTGRWRR